MTSIKEVDTAALVARAAEELAKNQAVQPPPWAPFVKTGVHKERPPTQDNWWHLRAAAVLRRVYLDHTVGVQRLRKQYGGRKNRGHKPEHKYRGSGAILRKVLQQLEQAGYVKKDGKKGRTITPQGQAFLDGVAKSVRKK